MSWTAANPVQRMSLQEVAPRTYASLARFADGAREPLPDGLAALIDIRVSQLNGCAYCLEMHYPQARAAGVDQRTLDTLPAWRDSPLFSSDERAALGLAEAVTQLGPDGVPDDVWAQAAASFDDEALAGIVLDDDRHERVEPRRDQHAHGRAARADLSGAWGRARRRARTPARRGSGRRPRAGRRRCRRASRPTRRPPRSSP